MGLTAKDKKELIKVIKTEYTREQLKEFWVKCFSERALLICSTDFEATDITNMERKSMLETLKELQDITGRLIRV